MCNFYIDIIIIFCYSKINNIIKLLIKNCKKGEKNKKNNTLNIIKLHTVD